MIRQLGEAEEPKKPLVSAKTGSKERHDDVILGDEEIDPADFFDPEEFGFRRRGSNARP
jgi:hypothetical protein